MSKLEGSTLRHPIRSVEGLFAAHEPREPFIKRRAPILKRILLFIILLTQVASYIILTQARYLGQGLSPKYLRFTTISDVLSLGLSLLTILLIIRNILKTQTMSLGRTVSATAFSLILLWLDFGVKRFEASEFSPIASIVLLISFSALVAILSTRSNPERSYVKRILRITRNTALVLFTLALFSFAYSFTYPSYTDITEIRNFDADAGVVLGAAVWRGHQLGDRPSPTFRERINNGYDLLSRNAIPRLVVTGASAPGEEAEAEVARKEFIKRGVDESKLISESESHSTLEQVMFLKNELFAKQGWDHFVIISDQYHIARVIEMCQFNGLKAIGSPSQIHQPIMDLAYYRVRESFALLAYWLIGK